MEALRKKEPTKTAQLDADGWDVRLERHMKGNRLVILVELRSGVGFFHSLGS